MTGFQSLVAENSSLSVTQSFSFIVSVNVGVGLASCLSFVGSITIMLSFSCFRELRTTGRFLLFNLSVADMAIAVSNLTGVITAFHYVGTNESQSEHDQETLCVIESSINLYATDCSVLWTIAVMLYVYLTVACVNHSTKANRILAVTMLAFCWGVPLIVVCTFLGKGFFKFDPTFSGGYFCTYISEGQWKIIQVAVGYEMFLYLAFTLLPVLSVAFVYHSKCKSNKDNQHQYSFHQFNIIRITERKLIFVPIAFIIIRMWGLISDIMNFYVQENISESYQQMGLSTFILFMANIGDASQGFVNCIFFTLLTPSVRRQMAAGCKRCCSSACICCSNISKTSFPILQSYTASISMSATLPSSIKDVSTPSQSRGQKVTMMTDFSSSTIMYYGSSTSNNVCGYLGAPQ